MKKIYLLFTLLILTLFISIPKVYGAYTFPTSISASGSHNNLYSNFYAVQVSKASIGTYANDKNFYFYIYSPIPGDLVTVNGTLKSQVYFYDNTNTSTATLDFNQFSGGDLVGGWYTIPAGMIPTGTSQFAMTIMSKSTSVWAGTSLLLFNQQAYYTYTSNLQLTMMIETNQQQAYQDGYDEGFEDGKNHAGGYNSGYNKGVTDTYQPAYDLGYNNGYNEGYDVGILEDYSAWNDIMNGFFGPFNILNFELLPGFKIGYVFAFFMIIGVLSFLIGKRKA